MKAKIFTVIAGTKACNAQCPYCISRMTPSCGVGLDVRNFNWRNFNKAAVLADKSGVTTALITGKGEPTLFPEQISRIICELDKHNFPIIELQTNGIILDTHFPKYKKHLEDWYKNGLTTIAISIVHYKNKRNNIILPNYPVKLERLIARLHKIGFTVRFSCLLVKNYIHSTNDLIELIEFSRKNNVEQLSLRTLHAPNKPEDCNASKWIVKNKLPDKNLKDIYDFLRKNAVELMKTNYGAIVYDFNGQNVCVTNALTSQNEEEIRQLIFFPDGHLRYDWQYKGAILL